MALTLSKLDELTKYPDYTDYKPGACTKPLYYVTEYKFLQVYRIVITFPPGEDAQPDYIIGDRNELLHAKGDRIISDVRVRRLIPFMSLFINAINREMFEDDTINVVLYFQADGMDYHLLNIALLNESYLGPGIELDDDSEDDMQYIRKWREANYRKMCFAQQHVVEKFADFFDLKRQPSKGIVQKDNLPMDADSLFKWLMFMQIPSAKITSVDSQEAFKCTKLSST